MWDSNKIRSEFPILNRIVDQRALVYLDNAATTQKPKKVLDSLSTYYKKYNANVHRGIHRLSQEATAAMEESRANIQSYINAAQKEEVIFTSGTTESINLIANSWGSLLNEGDEIILSTLEHHSNIVPWQMLCERKGVKLKIIPLLPNQTLDLETYEKLLSERTRLVAINHVSNALGVINPVDKIIELAHQKGAKVMIDAAQSAAHFPIDVQKNKVDFLVFSAHKMYGPTGVGVLYAKREWLEEMPPYKGGGEMIAQVTFETTTYAELPFKFEAGTPNIADNIAFSAALDFIQEIGLDAIQTHEQHLLSYCQSQLETLEEVEIYAKDAPKSGAISFNIKNQEAHPSDVGFILDKQGIAVRTGHHCTQPLMHALGIKGTVRASFAVYNTVEEVDEFILALQKAIGMLS